MNTALEQKLKPYADRVDFCRIFEEKMTSLYQLSFLLTANHDKAEKSFVTGLEESAQGPEVFREWAEPWARRSIIRSAIRLFNLGSGENNHISVPRSSCRDGSFPTKEAHVIAILDLPPFERFVFVMSVLERYSNHECSLLLGCNSRDVAEAQTRALRLIGSFRTDKRFCGQTR